MEWLSQTCPGCDRQYQSHCANESTQTGQVWTCCQTWPQSPGIQHPCHQIAVMFLRWSTPLCYMVSSPWSSTHHLTPSGSRSYWTGLHLSDACCCAIDQFKCMDSNCHDRPQLTVFPICFILFKKRHPLLFFCDYSVKCPPIFIIFGNTVADKICNWTTYTFLIISSLSLNITEQKNKTDSVSFRRTKSRRMQQ